MSAELADLAEAILYDYDPRDRPGDLELVERPDLLMWTRPSPTKWSSSVRLARWRDDEVEQRIDEVLAFFRTRGRPFVWHVGPSSAPSDLPLRLERHGFVRGDATRLLVSRLPVDGLRLQRDVRIVDARSPREVEAFLRFGHPAWSEDEVRSELPDRLRYLDVYGGRAGFVLAYLGETLVANAAWRCSTDGRAVYLTGAGTVEEHRGKGIYQTLTQYRLTRAAALGCRYAAIQAQVDTSMPILQRRGFSDAGDVIVLSWEPR